MPRGIGTEGARNQLLFHSSVDLMEFLSISGNVSLSASWYNFGELVVSIDRVSAGCSTKKRPTYTQPRYKCDSNSKPPVRRWSGLTCANCDEACKWPTALCAELISWISDKQPNKSGQCRYNTNSFTQIHTALLALRNSNFSSKCLTHWGREGSFKLFKRPLQGFLTISTL